MGDTGTARIQNVDDVDSIGNDSDCDDSVSDGAQVSTTIKAYGTVSISSNSVQDNDDPPQSQDKKCVAVPTCLADSLDHRKVVSHIFGRNKGRTRALPDNLWIYWCRKHYQRLKYRAEDTQSWHTRQLGLVRTQLQTFEDWGQVRSWDIELRKAEKDAIAKENKNGTTYTNYISSCWERFLLNSLGENKSFAEVRQVLDLIERKFNETEYINREKKFKTFPGVEFLPNMAKAKEAKKPAVLKKGEAGYKKITLDQAAFKRKTHVNKEIIKDIAAKKSEASNSPRNSRTPSKKGKSPETDSSSASDSSASKKRKTPATHNATTEDATSLPDNVTPPSGLSHSLFIKRRRLTRGFDKHGSDSDGTTSYSFDKNGSDSDGTTSKGKGKEKQDNEV